MIFLDTSLMVAAFIVSHPHYDDSRRLLASCQPAHASASLHSLAELYATVTRMPLFPRPTPDDVLVFIESIRSKLTWVELSQQNYLRTLSVCAKSNIQGGRIYDALIFSAAEQANAKIVYTWNLKDFKLLAQNLPISIRSPDLYDPRD